MSLACVSGNLKSGFQLSGLRNLRQGRSLGHALADVHIESPAKFHPRPHGPCSCSTCDFSRIVEGAFLIDRGLLHGELRSDGIFKCFDFFLSQVVLLREFLRLHLGGFDIEISLEAKLAELLERLFGHLSCAILRGNGGGLSALVHELIFELRLRLFVSCLCPLERIFRVEVTPAAIWGLLRSRMTLTAFTGVPGSR